jgi:hypothetical protein
LGRPRIFDEPNPLSTEFATVIETSIFNHSIIEPPLGNAAIIETSVVDASIIDASSELDVSFNIETSVVGDSIIDNSIVDVSLNIEISPKININIRKRTYRQFLFPDVSAVRKVDEYHRKQCRDPPGRCDSVLDNANKRAKLSDGFVQMVAIPRWEKSLEQKVCDLRKIQGEIPPESLDDSTIEIYSRDSGTAMSPHRMGRMRRRCGRLSDGIQRNRHNFRGIAARRMVTSKLHKRYRHQQWP